MLASDLVTELQSLLPMLWVNPGERVVDDPIDPEHVGLAWPSRGSSVRRRFWLG
ncbi:MAG: hypothetical protein ACRBBM_18695 [Pseudomonadaceae bacterium]